MRRNKNRHLCLSKYLSRYFHYHEGGKHKKLYLGKTEDLMVKLKYKRAASSGING